jgi:hypothetical protein
VSEVKKDFKNPEIPRLSDYKQEPSEQFWSSFPNNCNSGRVSTPINVKKLSELCSSVETFMTVQERLRASRTIVSLRKGAHSYQKSYLKGCVCPNGDSAFQQGDTVTDTIATWVKKDFVCGPFRMPPFRDFRCNKIIAIVQPTKVRPCLD